MVGVGLLEERELKVNARGLDSTRRRGEEPRKIFNLASTGHCWFICALPIRGPESYYSSFHVRRLHPSSPR